MQAVRLGLKIWDGYRPVRATFGMVEWAERAGQRWVLDEGYVARRSRHNLGLAVDLTLIDRDTGEELDLDTPYDEFSARAHTANAEGEILLRRIFLVRGMEAVGFQNYAQEW